MAVPGLDGHRHIESEVAVDAADLATRMSDIPPLTRAVHPHQPWARFVVVPEEHHLGLRRSAMPLGRQRPTSRGSCS